MVKRLSVDQTLMKARSYVKNNEIEEAQKIYKSILLAFPKNKRAQQELVALNKLFQNNGIVGPPQQVIDQLINLYTSSIGQGVFVVISIAAFTTMFSTTITCLDASPRTMKKTFELLNLSKLASYKLWIIILSAGTLLIFIFFMSEMGLLVKVATILSFITAPFYAIANYTLINSRFTPKQHRPGKSVNILSILGLDFETSISGAATAISNVGPGLGEEIGPSSNFNSIPILAKWTLCSAMILGRLELFTILVLFTPGFWKY